MGQARDRDVRIAQALSRLRVRRKRGDVCPHTPLSGRSIHLINGMSERRELVLSCIFVCRRVQDKFGTCRQVEATKQERGDIRLFVDSKPSKIGHSDDRSDSSIGSTTDSKPWVEVFVSVTERDIFE